MSVLTEQRRELYSQIPPLIRNGLVKFFIWGYMPGGFLRAVLENDLRETFARADEDSKRGLSAIMTWLYSFPPSAAHGRPEKVNKWSFTLEQEENPLELAMGLKEGLQIFQELGSDIARQAIEEVWGVRIEE